MIEDLKLITEIVNRMQEDAAVKEKIVPQVESLLPPMNRLFALNDILCCLIVDLQESGNPEALETLRKYGIEVKKDDQFQMTYERVQARINPVPAKVE